MNELIEIYNFSILSYTIIQMIIWKDFVNIGLKKSVND